MTIARVAAAVALLALSGCYVPTATIAPQPTTAIVYGSYCAAGAYQCPLSQATPVGTGCSCPGLGAPSYGTVR